MEVLEMSSSGLRRGESNHFVLRVRGKHVYRDMMIEAGYDSGYPLTRPSGSRMARFITAGIDSSLNEQASDDPVGKLGSGGLRT